MQPILQGENITRTIDFADVFHLEYRLHWVSGLEYRYGIQRSDFPYGEIRGRQAGKQDHYE